MLVVVIVVVLLVDALVSVVVIVVVLLVDDLVLVVVIVVVKLALYCDLDHIDHYRQRSSLELSLTLSIQNL